MEKTKYRAEMRLKDGTWRTYYGTVRLSNGQIASPEWVGESVENVREAVSQWDPEGKISWRIVERKTHWTERVVATV